MAIIFSTEHRCRWETVTQDGRDGGDVNVEVDGAVGGSVAVMEQQQSQSTKRGWRRRRRQLSLAQQLVYGLLVILISLTGEWLEASLGPFSSASATPTHMHTVDILSTATSPTVRWIFCGNNMFMMMATTTNIGHPGRWIHVHKVGELAG